MGECVGRCRGSWTLLQAGQPVEWGGQSKTQADLSSAIRDVTLEHRRSSGCPAAWSPWHLPMKSPTELLQSSVLPPTKAEALQTATSLLVLEWLRGSHQTGGTGDDSKASPQVQSRLPSPADGMRQCGCLSVPGGLWHRGTPLSPLKVLLDILGSDVISSSAKGHRPLPTPHVLCAMTRVPWHCDSIQRAANALGLMEPPPSHHKAGHGTLLSYQEQG